MLFKTLPIILLLSAVTISFSHGKNVNNENKYLLNIPGFFNRVIDTSYFDTTDPTAPGVDTNNNHASGFETLPPAVLLDMPVPGDQGKQLSCGAWATVYGAGSYYMHLITGKPYSDSENLSPAFVYNQVPKGAVVPLPL